MSLRKDIRHASKICAYCGKELLRFEDKTADHIQPKSKGGRTKLSNIVCCCKKRCYNPESNFQDLNSRIQTFNELGKSTTL